MTFVACTARSARALIYACLFAAAATGPLTASAGAVFDRVKATGTLRVCIWPGDDEWPAAVDGFAQRIRQDGRLEAVARHNGLTPIVVR